MRKYWLILDSYVFLWKDEHKVVVYNSLSGKGFENSLSPVLKEIVTSLLDIANLYCIEISDSMKDDPSVNQFIGKLRTYFCGDIVLQSNSKRKPISVVPQLNINEEVGRDYGDVANFETFGHHVVKNLLNLTIYLDGNVENSDLCKQFLWSMKGNEVLEKEKLLLLFDRVKNSRVMDFDIVSQDLFGYPSLDLLLDSLSKSAKKVSFYTDYLSVKDKRQLDRILQCKDYNLYLLVDRPLQLEVLDTLTKECKGVRYVTYVTSMEEYEEMLGLMDRYKIEIKIYPYYNGNKDFFESSVFLDKDDILNTKWSKQNIFAHHVLNMEYFGKFHIVPSGDVYSNFYAKPIGTLDDSLKELVYKEIKDGKSWRKTRDKVEPCKDCVYRYLCPSPSNYELVIGHHNLCHIK